MFAAVNVRTSMGSRCHLHICWPHPNFGPVADTGKDWPGPVEVRQPDVRGYLALGSDVDVIAELLDDFLFHVRASLSENARQLYVERDELFSRRELRL
jgi:hypothetical protein